MTPKFKTLALVALLTSCGVAPHELVRINHTLAPWPHAIVPYEIDPRFADDYKAQIEEAMLAWEKVTKLRFVPKTDHFNYVYINRSFEDQCNADLGFVGFGKQNMNLTQYACSTNTIKHEIGHTVGMIHEHQRIDRDDYVTIHWQNVTSGYEDQFSKLSPIHYPSPGEYDRDSIMHYTSFVFSNNGNATLTMKNTEDYLKFFPNPEISQGDINKIEELYYYEKNDLP